MGASVTGIPNLCHQGYNNKHVVKVVKWSRFVKHWAPKLLLVLLRKIWWFGLKEDIVCGCCTFRNSVCYTTYGTAAGLQRIATTRVPISPQHHGSHLDVDFCHINSPHFHWVSFYYYICSTVRINLHWSLLRILTSCCHAIIMEITFIIQSSINLSSGEIPVVLLVLQVHSSQQVSLLFNLALKTLSRTL